jgi:folylpolyglutamate synthase
MFICLLERLPRHNQRISVTVSKSSIPMASYAALVARLINRHPSERIQSWADKISQITRYSTALFGGPISIPSIVVSGTKGKGSTCAVAESILRYNGVKTGLFTSPHLTTARERIRVNGLAISELEYVDAYNEIDSVLAKRGLPGLPFFAIHTVMAGLVFKKRKIEAAVIECGVGGRYDWTRLFVPKVTGITSLGYDHLETLGKTPHSITWHKFGICGRGSKNFTTVQDPEFDRELKELSRKTRIPVEMVQPIYKGDMGLAGPCAEENSAVGVALARALAGEMGLRPFEVAAGVKNAEIGGRFQCFPARGVDWMLDGAHTLESVQFCNKWYESKHRDSSENVLVCATTKRRDALAILAPVLSGKRWKEIIWVKEYQSEVGLKECSVVDDLPTAINRAIAARPKSVLVTGSLHLVGDMLKELGWRPTWLSTS